ncbi:hypothetical protein [Exiguobacterium artemiae]
MKRWALYRIFIIVTMFARYIWTIYRFTRKNRPGTNNEEFERIMITIARDYKKKPFVSKDSSLNSVSSCRFGPTCFLHPS